MGIFCIFSLGIFMIFSPASRHLGMAFTPNRNAACQTREPWHLSCHGGKTPAKPHVPLCPLPAFGGQSGVKGHCPLGERGKLADVAETEVLQKAVRGGIENGPA